jgi:phosphatidylserine/phosphatidylglycerophosphate/cardiolipin synthase-like enzyme
MATATNVTFLTVALYLLWYLETYEQLREDVQPHSYETEPGDVICQVVPSGPGFPDENNLRLFNSLIYSAQRRLSITSPYFVPDDSLLYAITTAAQRGIDVELFVGERVRIRSFNTGSRAAVLRRSEGTRFSSPSDDEAGGNKARSARSERSEWSNQIGLRDLGDVRQSFLYHRHATGRRSLSLVVS